MNQPPPRKPSVPQPVQPQVHQTVVHVQWPAPSQALPALTNLLCWTGTGQLIQGRVLSAILFSAAEMIAAASCFVLVGFFLGR